MALYQEVRPDKITRMFGNKDTVAAIKSLLARDKPPQAYLLTGGTGTGKTTIGRIIATSVDAKGSDFKEINSADFRGIDTVRKMINDSKYRALQGKSKCWLIDEFHMALKATQQALLKLLEDPPPNCYFILATTNPEKILKAIKGRCTQFTLQTLAEQSMRALLKSICRQKKITVSEEVIAKIIDEADGHPRNAIQFLDKVRDIPEDKQLELIRKSDDAKDEAMQIWFNLLAKNPFQIIAPKLQSLKSTDPERLRRLIMACAQNKLISSCNPQAAKVLDNFVSPFYDSGFPGFVNACWKSLH